MPCCRYGQAPFPHQLHHERISRMRLLEPQRCRHRARPRHPGFGRPGCTGQGMCRYGHPSPILHGNNCLATAHEHDDLCGCDKFHLMHPDTDWLAGLRHAEKIGLGTMKYELVKI